MTIERRIGVNQVKETLKNNKECVFSTSDEMDKLNKIDSLRKKLLPEDGMLRDISFNLYELFDDIALEKIEKTNYNGNESLSIWEKSEKTRA